MDLLQVILTFAAAYGIFVFLAYVLARLFFPTHDDQEREIKEKRVRTRSMKDLASR